MILFPANLCFKCYMNGIDISYSISNIPPLLLFLDTPVVCNALRSRITQLDIRQNNLTCTCKIWASGQQCTAQHSTPGARFGVPRVTTRRTRADAEAARETSRASARATRPPTEWPTSTTGRFGARAPAAAAPEPDSRYSVRMCSSAARAKPTCSERKPPYKPESSYAHTHVNIYLYTQRMERQSKIALSEQRI